MATHSSVLAWRIPCTEEPGGLQSMQSQRVGHNCAHTITEKKMLPSVLTHVRRKCSYYHTQIIRWIFYATTINSLLRPDTLF